MRSSIVFLVLACLATGSMASITIYPFCSTGTMPVNQFCTSKCGGSGFTKTCTCSPNAARSLCNPDTGKCDLDNVCAVSSTFLMTSDVFGFIGDLEEVEGGSSATTLQQCACACKNDPQCQGFAWTTINGLITLGNDRCFLGRFRTTQTPMTPCLMPADFSLNAYLGLTLAFKKSAINTSKVQKCDVANLLCAYIYYLTGENVCGVV